MRFRYHEIATLPPLAWCARIDRGNDVVGVFHGSLVETSEEAFHEGAWDGRFGSFDAVSSPTVCGTGGHIELRSANFIASTDQHGPLFSIAKRGAVHVSNSPAFAMSAAREEPDPIYPFYAYDFLRIYRQGLDCPSGRVRLRSGNALRVHFTTILTIDRDGEMRFSPHRSCEAPRDFASYKALLVNGVANVLANATDPARKRIFSPLASISRGYDSTATAVLARSAGCTEAYTFIDVHKDDPRRDSGKTNAQSLGMRCEEYGRWDYVERDDAVEAEHAYVPTSPIVTLAALEARLPGRIVVVGDSGDVIWDLQRADACDRMTRAWMRFTIGLSAIEFRLRVGYQMFAATCIAARHNRAIHRIATSDEMRPWSIGGDYDRPIPRRIVEEAGLARERFGMLKAASGQGRLTDPSRYSKKGLSEYRAFVRRSHDAIAPSALRYWRLRARWRDFVWDSIGSPKRRFVRPTLLQRNFPFILNAFPLRVPWDFAFTFQWTAETARPRYAAAAEAAAHDVDGVYSE